MKQRVLELRLSDHRLEDRLILLERHDLLNGAVSAKDRVEHFDAHWVHQIDHMNKENPRRTCETLDQLVMRNDARPSGVRKVKRAPFQLHQIMLKVLQATARMLDVLKLHKALPFRRLYIDARRKLGRERAHESKDVLLGDGARAIPQEKHLLGMLFRNT